MMRNQRGFMTMDFLFAIALILGFWMLLFSVTMTLTTASVVQYVTFSSARNYFAGHADVNKQKERAEAKYTELLGNGVLKPLLSNGWFVIEEVPDIGDITQIRTEFDGQGKNKFYGVGTEFTARLLDMNIPFFGKTDPESDGSGSAFTTYIGSYIGREPTAAECLQFTENRWNAIRNLSVSKGTSYSSGTGTDGYIPMEDSGC